MRFSRVKENSRQLLPIAVSYTHLVEELAQAAEIFVLSVKLVSVEKLLGAK